MIKDENIGTPKTIIFCDTINCLTQVINCLTMQLGTHAFYPQNSKKREDSLLGIFHSMTQDKYKKIFESLKGNGTKRVVVATSALSMGVNFPDIGYVVMYGPPRNLLDFHQQAGRAGHDGTLAHTVLFYYAQQVANVEKEMKEFLSCIGCFTVASYRKFDQEIVPQSPGHIRCNFCSENCVCGSAKCKQVHIPPEQSSITDTPNLPSIYRSVTEEDKILLTEALEAHQNNLCTTSHITVLGSLACHGFSNEATVDVLDNYNKLFTVKDVVSCIPAFSIKQEKEILSIINEVFNYIDETTFVDDSNDSNAVTPMNFKCFL